VPPGRSLACARRAPGAASTRGAAEAAAAEQEGGEDDGDHCMPSCHDLT
jgi:hypothetical protein